MKICEEIFIRLTELEVSRKFLKYFKEMRNFCKNIEICGIIFGKLLDICVILKTFW